MRTPQFFIKIKKSIQSLFIKLYIFPLLCVIATVNCNKKMQPVKERVRVIKDDSGEDLFATFKKMGFSSGGSFIETKTSVTASYVTVKHTSGADAVENFLNIDKEGLPKLLLENLGRTKVNYDVMTKKVAKGKYNQFVLTPSNRDDTAHEDKIKLEVQMKIIKFFGKDIFQKAHNVKDKRSQSLVSDNKKSKSESREDLSKEIVRKSSASFHKFSPNEKIKLDTNPSSTKQANQDALKSAFMNMISQNLQLSPENAKVIWRIWVIL